jgi:glycosyltransferase involved in cell wall biosynthesis
MLGRPIRLIVDATAVREHGGGLSTYAVSLIRAWGKAFPDDQLVVVAGDAGGAGIMRAVTPDVRVSTFGGSRFFTQHGLIPLLTRKVRPHAVFSLVPAVPIIPLAVPLVSVVYDLRSWMHPDEFPVLVRAYRRFAYHYAFHRSARLITISERSRRDLAQVCRRGASKAHVIYPAADHVDDWPSQERAPHVMTFGHWTNKKPDMAIKAWATALGTAEIGVHWKLHVVGVPQGGRDALIRAASDLGVADSVMVHGYLPGVEYQRLFTSASAVLMLSTFEGYGLPVVEAMRRGVHVIASRDAALVEAGGESAAYVDDEDGLSSALVDLIEDRPKVREMVRSGLNRTRDMTWTSTAADARAVIQQAIAEHGTRIETSGTPDQ